MGLTQSRGKASLKDDQAARGYLAVLPTELLEPLLLSLSIAEVGRLAQLNHWWHNLLKDKLKKISKCYTEVWWAHTIVYRDKLHLPLHSLDDEAINSDEWDKVYLFEKQNDGGLTYVEVDEAGRSDFSDLCPEIKLTGISSDRIVDLKPKKDLCVATVDPPESLYSISPRDLIVAMLQSCVIHSTYNAYGPKAKLKLKREVFEGPQGRDVTFGSGGGRKAGTESKVAKKEGHAGGYAYMCTLEGKANYNDGWSREYWGYLCFSVRVELKTGQITVRRYPSPFSVKLTNLAAELHTDD